MSDIDPGALTPWKDRFSLEGRVALVTGAGGGIGRAFAWALAEAGAVVAAHDRTLDDLAPTRALFEPAGFTMSEFEADFEGARAPGDLVARVHARHSRIDVLINCAAYIARGQVDDTDTGTFDKVVAIDVRAPYFLSKAAHRLMRDAGGGSIVNIGSVNSFFGLDTVSVYGLSKGALAQFTKAAAIEWVADRVRVNSITPGFIQTPVNTTALWGDERRRSWILDRVPMARAGLPDDLIGALLYLASDASSFVTGQTIIVDGGFLAGGSWDSQGPVAWNEAHPAGTDTR